MIIEIESFEKKLRRIELDYLAKSNDAVAIFQEALSVYAEALIKRNIFQKIDPNADPHSLTNAIFEEYLKNPENFPEESSFANRFYNASRRENRKENDNSFSVAEIFPNKAKKGEDTLLQCQSREDRAENFFVNEITFPTYETMFIYKLAMNIYLYGVVYRPILISSKKIKRATLHYFIKENDEMGELIVKTLKSKIRKPRGVVPKATPNSLQMWQSLFETYVEIQDLVGFGEEVEEVFQELILQAASTLFSHDFKKKGERESEPKSKTNSFFFHVASKSAHIDRILNTEGIIYQIFELRSEMMRKISLYPLFLSNSENLNSSSYIFSQVLSEIDQPQIIPSRDLLRNVAYNTDSDQRATRGLGDLYLMKADAIPHILKLLESNINDDTQSRLFILLSRLHQYASPAVPYIESFIRNQKNTGPDNLALAFAKKALEKITNSTNN